MSSDRVHKMTRKEKEWWLKRLAKQFKDENDDINKHMRKTNRSGAKMYGV